jgi:hypothetical protein
MQSYNTDPEIQERILVHVDVMRSITKLLTDAGDDVEVIPSDSVAFRDNKDRILEGLNIIVGPINEQNTLNRYDPVTKLQIALENNQNIERYIVQEAKMKILRMKEEISGPYYKNIREPAIPAGGAGPSSMSGVPSYGTPFNPSNPPFQFKRTRKSVKKSTKRARKSVKKSTKRARKSVKKSTKRARKSVKKSTKRARKSGKKSTKRARKSGKKSTKRARKSGKKSTKRARKSVKKSTKRASRRKSPKKSTKRARKSPKKSTKRTRK